MRSILENPRYTGYAFFGRWTKHETLLDPDNVAAGHVVRFRRSNPDRVVRSRQPAHPAIVSVEQFTEVQLVRRSRGAGGLAARGKLERGQRVTKRIYPLRGRVRCGYCERRMEGTPRAARTYYRCAARSIVPGSPVLARHPKNVYLPERPVVAQLNGWLGDLFNPENRDATAERLLEEVGALRGDAARADQIRRKIAKPETELRRLQDAIKAGANPAALVDAINGAQERLEAARAELERLPAGRTMNRADVYAMIDYLGDVDGVLNRAEPAELQDLYEALHLEMIYQPEEQAVDVNLRLQGRGSTRVRGGTRPRQSRKTPKF